MAVEARLTVDTEKINALLRDLDMSGDEPKKAIRSALRNSGNIIRRAVCSGLSTISGDLNKRKGVRLTVYKNASGVRVDIYNPFYTANGKIFILRWLEIGAKNRRTIAGSKFRGSTAAKPFFEQAVNSSRVEAV